MRQSKSKLINRDQYDSVLFDMDGVITDTASLHAACWKQLFDEFLEKRAKLQSEEFCPFDIVTDYRLHVDGKPRFEGVRDFLKSRGIELPEGNAEDPVDVETVCGLGNRKNELVNDAIATKGVQAYNGSVQFIHLLHRDGYKLAVVTSSQNCASILKAVKLDKFFEVRVDGNTIHAQRLKGKPAPDTFLLAARLLGAEPIRTIVLEDAISGIQAGSAGKFGLVIGIARSGDADVLKRHGAHLVVRDLDELIE
jgi:beta-phosphoglucomutase family hydrolase